MTNDLGSAVAAQALTWVGTPFLHAGRVKGSEGGVDCVGVLVGVAHELGLTDYDNRVYSRHVIPEILISEIERVCSPVLEGPSQIGDVLIFRVSGVAQHVGIQTTVGFVHAWESVGKVVETRLDRFWGAQVAQVLRVDPAKVNS